jgi:hypothetical protein
MASASDWTTRKNRVIDQFTSVLPTLITNYELKTRALDDLIQQTTKLEDEKGRLEHQIDMAEQDASTADREFLERKSTFPDPFKPSKVATIQDFTFLLFFVSYFVFLVAVSLIVQEKTKVFVSGLLSFIFVLVALYRYV